MNRLECKYTGLGVCICDRVFVSRKGYLYTGWIVSIRAGVLVNGMGC